MLMKICTKCGVEKVLDEFYRSKRGKFGRRSHCRLCDNIDAKEWYNNNVEMLCKKSRERQKERRKVFPEKVHEKERIYRENNIEKKRKIECLNGKKYANYLTYAHKLDYAEEVRDINNKIEVSCTYCNKWFKPSRQMVKHRINALNGRTSGEARLYCSEECKHACPIFKSKNRERGIKLATSREVPSDFRKIALEDRNHTCEKCNSIEDGLHVHHIEGYTEQPMFMADLSNVIVVCKKCHKDIHKQKGCNYQDYQCINKKEEST